MSPQSFKITIPKPCSQSWDDMHPAVNGRHCDSCNKTVIDFSGMSDEDVKSYFIANQHSATCGRFKKEQVERIRIVLPGYILQEPIASWKKYLAILLICFGSFIFQIDVVVAQTEILHEQPGHFQPITHKPIKPGVFISWDRLVSIGTETICNPDPGNSFLMGFTITEPVKEPVERDIASTFPAETTDSVSSPHVDTTIPFKKDPLPKKETDNRMEFYLPAPIASRRRIKK